MLCQTQEQLQQAKQEINYHKKLRHPNLLPLLDSAIHQQANPKQSTGGTCINAYLLFPYLSGGSLREETNRRVLAPLTTTGQLGAWPEGVLLRIFRGVVLGVRELHQNDLAHRDVKLENVLLKADGLTPVLIDFGG